MTPDDPVDVLARWLASGGEVRVLGEADGEVLLGLFTCDGGEEMGRVRAPEPLVRELLDGLDRS